MQLFSWLHKRMTGRPRTRSTSARKPTARFRPQLETLEGRDVPSTLTVTNNLDSGAGSLRADIAAAQSGDTIVFAPNLNGQTITLTSGELYINKNLTIQGPGAGQLTVSGGNTSRVFFVIANNVSLSGLTITQGNANLGPFSGYGGGGILDFSSRQGMLTISDCVLSDNLATHGGGIANVQGGSLKIVNSTLSGNSASGIGGEGGGIYSLAPTLAGTVAIENCTLSDNFAGHAGGGIWTGATMMTINGCTLSDNTEAYANGYLGDDIYSNGGAGATLTISDSVFISGNRPAIYGPWINGGGNTFE